VKRGLIVGLVLVAALAIAIVSCSRARDTDVAIATTASENGTTSSTMVSLTTTTAMRETTVAPLTQEPMTIKYATRFKEDDTGGKVIRRFIDYVKEATGGVVAFEVFFGGVLAGDSEELGLVGSGSVDMTSLALSGYADRLPLANFPMWAAPDAQAALDYAHHLVFDEPRTSLLIQAEAGVDNIFVLGFTSGGGNVFVSRRAFTGLADLSGKRFGASGFVPALEALGCDIVKTNSARMHDALAEGVFEAVRAGFKGSIDLKLYDVAKHFVWDGVYGVGSSIVINLDTWARLAPETRAVFYEAAERAADYSLELDSGYVSGQLEMLADAGVTVGSLGTEDTDKWYRLLFEYGAQGCMSRAQNLGIVEDMVAVLTEAARFMGLDWSPPAPTTTTVAPGSGTTGSP
jgi:TRAP-type C4-dicarboxylate transport system substrate-binding protein